VVCLVGIAFLKDGDSGCEAMVSFEGKESMEGEGEIDLS
jgi:hypothetical protein